MTNVETNNEAEVFDLSKYVEVLDTDGNPTGQYILREGEAAPEGTTFVAEDIADEVTVH